MATFATSGRKVLTVHMLAMLQLSGPMPSKIIETKLCASYWSTVGMQVVGPYREYREARVHPEGARLCTNQTKDTKLRKVGAKEHRVED